MLTSSDELCASMWSRTVSVFRMTTRLVILGAGGFGREVLDVIEAINHNRAASGSLAYEVLGFLDDGAPDPNTLEPYGVTVIGGVADITGLPTDVEYVIGVGDPAVRRKIAEVADEAGRRSPALVHPSVTSGRAVNLGGGTIVCAGARLTNNIQVGRHVHVNLNATIGHDAVLDDYVTLSPLVAVSGYAQLGAGAFVGTGATINPGVTVGDAAVIGAGGVVLRDVGAGVTAVGVPARAR